MILLGVDPASRSTGYGVVQYRDRGFRALEYGCIQTTSSQELPERIELLFDGIYEVIKRYSPEELIVEELFYARNVKTLITMGHMRSAVLLAAQKSGIHVVEYSAKAIKKSVTGNGGAAKEQVGFMARRLLGISESENIPHDATDALAVALTHGLKITF
ncbi:MAG: crossover junction endodeoxyribonuclease RuvC [bacterium]